jgi:ATP-dependent RNA helicase HelY
VAGLASRRTYPLKSSFAPTYNMAVNLMATLGRERARDLLNQSFAQFQTDKSVVTAARVGRQLQENLERAIEAVECHLGDFISYARLRDEISQLEGASSKARKAEHAEAVAHSLTTLLPGDVVHVPRQGWSVVLRVGQKADRHADPWVQIISGDHTVLKLLPHDLTGPVQPIGRVRVPRDFSLRERKDRRSLLTAMSAKVEQAGAEIPDTSLPSDDAVERQIRRLRTDLRAHPCHECPDREIHAVEAARVLRLEREAERAEADVTGRANSLARQFDRVTAVLEELGYLDGDQLTDAGRMLRRIYNELDLVAAECVRRDVFAGLTAPQLAAVLSTILYEARPTRDALPPRMPDAASERAQSHLRTVWRDVGLLERKHQRDRGREPDIGFAEAAWRWSSGQDLAKVLRHTSMSAGDFVRWVRQVIDLAGQLATATGPGDLRRTCHEVADSMRRGVVAADLTED